MDITTKSNAQSIEDSQKQAVEGLNLIYDLVADKMQLDFEEVKRIQVVVLGASLASESALLRYEET